MTFKTFYDVWSGAMQLSIPPDLQIFVEQEFATGLYQSREEIVLQAVSLLRDERVQAVKGIKGRFSGFCIGRACNRWTRFSRTSDRNIKFLMTNEIQRSAAQRALG